MSDKIIITRTNTETGEHMESEYEGDYTIKVTNNESAKSFRLLRNGLMDIHRGERYVKIYPARIDDILDEELTYIEMRLLLAVISHAIKFQTGEIVHEDMTPVTSDHLSQKAKVDISRGRAALRGLIVRRILDKERRGRGFIYYGNPFIFVCGNGVSQELFDRFKDSKWANLPIPEGLTDGIAAYRL